VSAERASWGTLQALHRGDIMSISTPQSSWSSCEDDCSLMGSEMPCRCNDDDDDDDVVVVVG